MYYNTITIFMKFVQNIDTVKASHNTNNKSK